MNPDFDFRLFKKETPMTIKPIPLLPVPSTEATSGRHQLCQGHESLTPSTQPDTDQPSTPPKRKRGAPFGNQNRLVHGFFSTSFTKKESHSLDTNVKGEFQDELSLLYILINRTAESINNDPHVAPDVYLNALRAITQAIARIESLRRSQHYLYNNQTTIEKALEELAFLPPEED
jgi:hypothetical protein